MPKKAAPSKLNPGKWAEDYLTATVYQGSRTVHHWWGRFWIWRRSHPWYEPLNEREMTCRVLTWLRRQGLASSLHVARDVTANIEGTVVLDRQTRQPSWLCKTTRTRDYLTMRDGIVNPYALAEGKSEGTLPSTPDWFSTTYLPYVYQPRATCVPWLDWQRRRLPEEEARLFLREWGGYLITSDYSRQCGVILHGPAGTGKTTIGNAMRDLVGADNSWSLRLDRWGSQFARTSLMGKLLLISDEIPPTGVSAVAETEVKEWIGGQCVTYEPKYCSVAQGEPLGRVMLLTNNWPKFKDPSGGIWRRWRVIKCREFIPRDDYDLDVSARMRAQVPGIFNWALKGLAQWMKTGKWTIVPSGELELETARDEIQGHRQFVMDRLFSKPGHFLPWPVLLKAYHLWCKQHACPPLDNKKDFGDEVVNQHPTARRGTRRRTHTSERGFYNINVAIGV